VRVDFSEKDISPDGAIVLSEKNLNLN